MFSEYNTVNPSFSYDICFNNWPLDAERYDSEEYKKWLSQAESALGGTECLFKYCYDSHEEIIGPFIDEFVTKFNSLAETNEYEVLPPMGPVEESD